MIRAYVALGANLNDPAAAVRNAIAALHRLPRGRVAAVSSLYRSAPVGLKHQPDFINAVVALDTELEARALLDELFGIEAAFGRRRSIPNAPRTLDLDLLLHGDAIRHDPQLTLPHPRMHLRAFVLKPLVEIAPDIRIPGRGPIGALIDACADQPIARLGCAP